MIDLQERKKIWQRFIEEGILSKQLPPLIACLLYTSPSPRNYAASRMPSSA